jgi:hypothetical protein
MDSHTEHDQPQHPEQKRDPRIPKVIQELSKSARLLADPRLLNPNANPEDGYNLIRYLSENEAYHIDLWKDDIKNTNPGNLPKDIEHKEKIIPLTIATWKTPPYSEGGFYQPVWLNLDSDKPAVYELMFEGGIRAYTFEATGIQGAKERPDLLPHILDAVSGKKAMYKGKPAHEDAEWKKTFETE